MRRRNGNGAGRPEGAPAPHVPAGFVLKPGLNVW